MNLENRELGENPKRTHHCEVELFAYATGYPGKAQNDDEAEPGDLPKNT